MTLRMSHIRVDFPSEISSFVDGTGTFALRVQKRYDGTRIRRGEIVGNGSDLQRSRAALRQINLAHRGFTSEA